MNKIASTTTRKDEQVYPHTNYTYSLGIKEFWKEQEEERRAKLPRDSNNFIIDNERYIVKGKIREDYLDKYEKENNLDKDEAKKIRLLIEEGFPTVETAKRRAVKALSEYNHYFVFWVIDRYTSKSYFSIYDKGDEEF